MAVVLTKPKRTYTEIEMNNKENHIESYFLYCYKFSSSYSYTSATLVCNNCGQNFTQYAINGYFNEMELNII